MALVLNHNSYVEMSEAEAYFATRIDSASWDDAAVATREDALVTATGIIDDNHWIGIAVGPCQCLAWPRTGVVYYDPRMGKSIEIFDIQIPKQVKVAVYEQALHLLNNEDLLGQSVQTYESISIGSISLSDNNNDVTRISISPSFIMKPLRPLLKKGSGGNSWWRAN